MISPSGTPARVKRRSPAVISVSADPCALARPRSRFIAGLPMKPATNRFAGRENTSCGVPICSAWPADMTTIRSARVIASIWSCVT